MQTPDIRTISDFRQRHLPALGELLVEVLRLCREAGLVTLWHVALDETKVKASASKHKAMSYTRMKKAESELGRSSEASLTRRRAPIFGTIRSPERS